MVIRMVSTCSAYVEVVMFEVYTRACDGTHLLGKYKTLKAAKQKVEVFCRYTEQCSGHVMVADWLSATVAVSAFGDRLHIEEVA